MEFERLEALRRQLRELKRLHSKSLALYFTDASASRQGVGFRHLWDEKTPSGKQKAYSHASTATCIVSLTSTGAWWHNKERVAAGQPWEAHTAALLEQLCSTTPKKWKSAGLKEGNPFTVAFTLEGLKALAAQRGKLDGRLAKKVDRIIRDAEALLLEKLQLRRDSNRGEKGTPNQFSEVGAANVDHYPPTSFLTQLVARALGTPRLSRAPKVKKKVEVWCKRQVEHELALLSSAASTADPLALAYAVTAFLQITDIDSLSPVDAGMVTRAVDYIFEAQAKDGSWPRSKPLHHYERFGNAYCYEYETLAQLLQCQYLESQLIGKLEKLELCVAALDRTANNLPDGGKAWPSGHHPHLQGAESWSTASVYQFVHHLDRLVAEAIRQVTFAYVRSPYEKPNEEARPVTEKTQFRPQPFLDSAFVFEGKPVSLRATIQDFLLRPIVKEIHQVIRGERLSPDTSISAILFGPPGTSKTTLAKEIAAHLGWPRLDIDPSHLFRGGLEQIQTESNRLFNMLAALERTVVFFDEFDEMVRERTSERADLMSRLLTTAMLPKLTRIAEERKIVFLLATNHIEDFDFAIARPGRFDMLIPVMPPSWKQKSKNWSAFNVKVRPVLNHKLPAPASSLTVRKVLEALTFAEFRELTEITSNLSNPDRLKGRIAEAWTKSTLSKRPRTRADSEKKYETLLDFYLDQCRTMTRWPKRKSA